MLTSLPNLLTYFRILAVPAVVGVFFLDYPVANWLSFGIYAAACITDYFDGMLARQLNQVSPLGRFLDPVADKLLIASVILMLTAFKAISGVTLIAAVIILCREFLVSGLREFLAGLQVGVPVSKLAKWKTTAQMTALGFLMVGPAGPPIIHCQELGTFLLWLAAILTLVTGYDYLRAGLKHLTAPVSHTR